MENIELKIEGMHCTGCSSRLEKILNNIEGVKSASVDLESKIAKISYVNEEVSIETIKDTITDAGFSC